MPVTQSKQEMAEKIKFDKINQLHNATLQFSNNTMEIKKLFVSVLIAYFTILATLNSASDITADPHKPFLYIITASFLFLDVQSYYYQKKLRAQIEAHYNELLNGNTKKDNTKPFPPTICNIIKCIFNPSMIIYLIAALCILIFI